MVDDEAEGVTRNPEPAIETSRALLDPRARGYIARARSSIAASTGRASGLAEHRTQEVGDPSAACHAQRREYDVCDGSRTIERPVLESRQGARLLKDRRLRSFGRFLSL